VNKSYNDFLSSLPTELASRAPGDLFDTSGLASIAGQAQGAQNLPFDPGALSGKTTPLSPKEDDTAPKKQLSASPF
jgi:hypothetical protein